MNLRAWHSRETVRQPGVNAQRLKLFAILLPPNAVLWLASYQPCMHMQPVHGSSQPPQQLIAQRELAQPPVGSKLLSNIRPRACAHRKAW